QAGREVPAGSEPAEQPTDASSEDRCLLVLREVVAASDEIHRLVVGVLTPVRARRFGEFPAGQANPPGEPGDVAPPHDALGAEGVDDGPQVWHDIAIREWLS